jgi:hypothetical protein
MVSFPRVVRPALVMYETWQQFAERVGAAKVGVDWLAAHCLIVLGAHIGTHMDSLRHMRDDAPVRKESRSSTATASASTSGICPKARESA